MQWYLALQAFNLWWSQHIVEENNMIELPLSLKLGLIHEDNGQCLKLISWFFLCEDVLKICAYNIIPTGTILTTEIALFHLLFSSAMPTWCKFIVNWLSYIHVLKRNPNLSKFHLWKCKIASPNHSFMSNLCFFHNVWKKWITVSQLVTSIYT